MDATATDISGIYWVVTTSPTDRNRPPSTRANARIRPRFSRHQARNTKGVDVTQASSHNQTSTSPPHETAFGTDGAGGGGTVSVCAERERGPVAAQVSGAASVACGSAFCGPW